MQMKLRTILISLFVMVACISYTQSSGKNYPNFQYKKFHFGCHLGVTTTQYRYELKDDISQFDSVYQITLNNGPGFAIHLPLISWNIHPTFHIRAIPSLTFHETEFVYSYIRKGERTTKTTRTQPTLLNFPILVKLNARRINNFSAYALAGFSYSYDLASNDDVDQSLADPVIKLSRNDYAYHVGGGFDFYLPYFKFGIELKLSNGIKNLLIQDDTFFSSPLNSLKSQVWWLSFTFEG